jgi:hypothetical protein
LFEAHVTPANDGCNFDSLDGVALTAEPDIY